MRSRTMRFAALPCSPWGKLKSMATGALFSAEQYLATHFGEREPEFVRGELVHRPMPTWLHGRLQHLLSVRLHGVGFCGTEVRMRLAADLFRIPDVAVFARS